MSTIYDVISIFSLVTFLVVPRNYRLSTLAVGIPMII
jgi:hypothetical protein